MSIFCCCQAYKILLHLGLSMPAPLLSPRGGQLPQNPITDSLPKSPLLLGFHSLDFPSYPPPNFHPSF